MFPRVTDFLSNQVNAFQVTTGTESKRNVARIRAYLDYLTHGPYTVAEMIVLLEKLFSLCRELKLKLHPHKCSLFLRKVRFLGHMLSEEGVHLIDKLLQKLRSTMRPQNKDRVKDLLGLAGY